MLKAAIENDFEEFFNRKDFDFLSNSKILITGATGFIGRWFLILIYLAKKKYALETIVYWISRNPNLFIKDYPFLADKDFISIKHDVKYPFEIEKEIDYVIIGASDTSLRGSTNNALEIYNASVMGTINTVEAIKKKSIRKIIFLSSGAARNLNSMQTNEITKGSLGTFDAYSLSKFFCEQYLNSFSNMQNCLLSSIRIYGVIGPGMSENLKMLLPSLFDQIKNNGSLNLTGSGREKRNFIYISDLIKVILKSLESRNSYSFEVGTRETLSTLEIAEIIASVTGFSGTIEILSNHKASDYLPDISSFPDYLLEFKFIDLKQALERTWSRKN